MMNKDKVATSILLLFSIYFMLVGILLHIAITMLIMSLYVVYKAKQK